MKTTPARPPRKLPSLAALALFALLPAAAPAQDITFSAEQVEKGKAAYREHCQICHGSTLANGQFGTPLRGAFFRGNWSGKSLGELVRYTWQTMPPENVMMLATGQYAELIAYILEANSLTAGAEPMPGELSVLDGIALPW